MLDPEIPPEAEGETDGGEGVAHRIAAEWALAATGNTAEFTPLPWITATVPR